MNIKQTLLSTVFAVGLTVSALLISNSQVSAANHSTSCGVETSIISCTPTGGDNVEGTAIWQLLLLVINIMTAGVGVLAVAGIVWGSILYTSAGGSPDQVKKARTVITNVVIGLVAYALMFALLQYLIPGGIFRQ